MDLQIICPTNYYLRHQVCYHQLFPLNLQYIIGTAFLSFVTILCALSGLGGGGIIIPSLIMIFNYLPKDATMVVFPCMLGTSLGNISNLLQDSVDGNPLINYKIVFVSIPIIFTGAIIGVILNKIMPGVTICFILFVIFGLTIGKNVSRFMSEYRRENRENQENTKPEMKEKHERMNPFKNEMCVFVFKNLTALVIFTTLFSFCRGSEKFPSIIGIQPCSFTFWFLTVFSFLFLALFSYRNILIAKTWTQNTTSQKLISKNQIISTQNPIHQHLTQIIVKSMVGGIISGFGIGGGIILTPMYRNAGCSSLSSAASFSFGILLTSFINTIQGISIGVIQPSQFLYFTLILTLSAYLLSRSVSQYLKKINRMSYITGFFILFITFGTINIPYSVYQKYVESGYNSDIVIGFGSIC